MKVVGSCSLFPFELLRDLFVEVHRRVQQYTVNYVFLSRLRTGKGQNEKRTSVNFRARMLPSCSSSISTIEYRELWTVTCWNFRNGQPNESDRISTIIVVCEKLGWKDYKALDKVFFS